MRGWEAKSLKYGWRLLVVCLLSGVREANCLLVRGFFFHCYVGPSASSPSQPPLAAMIIKPFSRFLMPVS